VSGNGTVDAPEGAAMRELTEAGVYHGGRDPGFARRFALAAGFGWRGRVEYRVACWLARRQMARHGTVPRFDADALLVEVASRADGRVKAS
jgi:hypothetical protein